MRTVVLGKVVEKNFSVETNIKTINKNGKECDVYTGKPKLQVEEKIKEWKEICSFKGEYRKNHIYPFFYPSVNQINISENETVTIDKEIFRADLNELHLFTDKVVEEINKGMEIAEIELIKHTRLFNKMMIESNDSLTAYCNLHKLNYGDTDAIELFKIVFPEKEFEIKDGVLRVKEQDSYVLNFSDTYATLESTALSAISAL